MATPIAPTDRWDAPLVRGHPSRRGARWLIATPGAGVGPHPESVPTVGDHGPPTTRILTGTSAVTNGRGSGSARQAHRRGCYHDPGVDPPLDGGCPTPGVG